MTSRWAPAGLRGDYDIVALGEVLLRLDPGHGRVRTAHNFAVWEGGGEYNVARALAKCFGLRAAIVTALVRNDVGLLIEDLMMRGGVDTGGVVWRNGADPEKGVRNGLTFASRGFGVRRAQATVDRSHTAASMIAPSDVDWTELFRTCRVRWFHSGGVFAALSDNTAETARAAMTAARRAGTTVSYDLNYRPSLWTARGGPEGAQAVTSQLVELADVVTGNEEEFALCLGIESPPLDAGLTTETMGSYAELAAQVGNRFPNLRGVAVSARSVSSASHNDWSGVYWSRDEGASLGPIHHDLDIFDRVGAGDSFASGLIFSLLSGHTASKAVEYAVAHAALTMTTPGDTSSSSLDEVEALISRAAPRIDR
ncbi:PfkB family carbohydrate kinase [Amycolatopsis sp. NPDC049868]|uniref:PfkB family carbohydrate kinase n=1 Tax=Amycolatopsis sp. NPDC049868 TaxID=3363934 RepID=UPI0037B7AA1A